MTQLGMNEEIDNLNDNLIEEANPDNRLEEEINNNPNSNAISIEAKLEELRREGHELRPLLESFDQEFNNPENAYCYVISAKWLRNWKAYTSYDDANREPQPDEDLHAKVCLEKINADIVQEPSRVAKYPEEDDCRNTFLKEQIQEKVDYELITEAAWNYLAKKYQNIPIKRPVYTRPNGMRYVEVALKQIRLVPLNNNFLKDVDHKRVQEFKVYVIQASAQTTLKDFKAELAQICNLKTNKHWFESATSYISMFTVSEETLRLWKLDPSLTLKTFFHDVKKICDESRTYDYQIEFKGNLLEKDLEVKLEDAQIAEEDYMFVEARESHKGWSFFGDGAPVLAKCDFCNKYGELPVQCSCKKVSYCNEDCRNNDKRYHRSRCDKAGEDEEKESETLVENENSKRGLVGLQNLGNTCFMNSGLQCLSNIKELTQYFLSDKYLGEINETNPLGTKGKLVKKYAAFLKHVWFGSSSVYSPWSLKMGIAEFQPMFSGYQQHDSQELLAFLIDGLHEDLNRVKNKPFTETIESEGQNDYAAALKSWEVHLKRNQSMIVDLLYGQFKSQITCPTCARVSITFDPFNTVSLPISIKKEKEIDFFFISAKNKRKSVKLAFSFDKATHTVAQLREQTAKLLDQDPKTFYFVFSTYHSKELVTDEEKTLTNELRKKKKFKTLFALEFSDEDLNADPEDRINVDIHTTKKAKSYYGSDIHKPLTFVRIVSLRKSYTLKQVYLKIFSDYRFVFDASWPEAEKEEWLKLSDEEAFHKIWEEAENKPFNVHFIKNYTSSYTCYFCEQKKCDNCIMPYDENITLSDILAKIKDPDYKFELEIVFDNLPEYMNPADTLNAFDDLTKKVSGKDGSQRGIAIQDCFDQFELPEQLGEENAWYCSKCKEHQRATKKMEIYKAPPILLLHFKRFKSGNSLYKKGKITEKVEFPIEDLDISEYVINHELPTDYPVETLAPNFTALDQTQPTGDASSELNVEKMNLEKDEAESIKSSDTQGKMIVEGATKVKSGLLYDLFAVVNHYGNLGFGHYTAFAKNHKDGQWYNFDDSRVSQEKPENVCTPAAYVLFYKRKDWEFKL